MRPDTKWRIVLIAVVVLVSVIYVLPTLGIYGRLPDWFQLSIPQSNIQVGVDKEGNGFILFSVDQEVLREVNLPGGIKAEEALKRAVGILKEELMRVSQLVEGAPGISPQLKIDEEKDILAIYRNFKETQILKRLVGKMGYTQIPLWLYRRLPHNRINLGLDLKGGMQLILGVDTSNLSPTQRKGAVDRALEIIRNRVDEFGVAEPSIRKYGGDKIRIQLPGVKDPQRAIEIIKRVALLEFKLVDNDPRRLEEALAGNVPAGYELKFLEEKGGEEKEPLLVEKEARLTGDMLTRAYVSYGRFNRPQVTLRFNRKGARIFARITGRNVGKRLAIVLDGKVRSAPVIREQIPGGEAVITGRFTPKEAADLALVLRTGSLPAPIKILYQERVGPSMGKDSIRQGVRAALVGALLVVLLMAVYYRLSGLLADFALFLNLLIIMAALAGFGATLTLPGMAGIVLTIGMAVDANVLIFERIKEELRMGKTVRAAVNAGYRRALLTITDANLTTLIAAIILYGVGTGPIKGFAVTLSIGIMASMFTAIVLTRLVYDLILSRKKVTRLSI